MMHETIISDRLNVKKLNAAEITNWRMSNITEKRFEMAIDLLKEYSVILLLTPLPVIK